MSATGCTTPAESEQAFHDAFRRADLNAMMNVWAEPEFIEAVHPKSERAHSRAAVESGWRQTFSAAAQAQIELSGMHRIQDAVHALHVLHERLGAPGSTPTIADSNIHQFIDGSWHMILHHASPVPDSDTGTSTSTAHSSTATESASSDVHSAL